MDKDVLTIILSVAEIIISIALIIVILMQSKNASGLTGALGGMGQSNTYWDKNKGRSLEGKLTKYTKILATLFVIFALIIAFIPAIFSDSSASDTTTDNPAVSTDINSDDAADAEESDEEIVVGTQASPTADLPVGEAGANNAAGTATEGESVDSVAENVTAQ